jgi:hypothetical protein
MTIDPPIQEHHASRVPPGLLQLIGQLTEKYGMQSLRIADASLRQRMGRASIVLQVPEEKLDDASRDAALLVTQIRQQYNELYAVIVLPEAPDGESVGEPFFAS